MEAHDQMIETLKECGQGTVSIGEENPYFPVEWLGQLIARLRGCPLATTTHEVNTIILKPQQLGERSQLAGGRQLKRINVGQADAEIKHQDEQSQQNQASGATL